MAAFWTEPDFDAHERVEFVHDRSSGLTAIFALHSTHLGPAAGGTRFLHYPDPEFAIRDALRLSRGMSYKSAMAGLPVGGGKAVILAEKSREKSAELLSAFGDAVNDLGGAYITTEDVGMTEADMAAIARRTAYVTGLPAENEHEAGGDPGPFTARGVFLGIKQAVAHKLGKDDLEGVHVAIQGTGSVGSGVARLLADQGAQLTLADANETLAASLAQELGAKTAAADSIMDVECDVFSPNALGAILDDRGIERLRTAIVAGGANNQLAEPTHGQKLAARGILYAPDYVINAGGIIAVTFEYLARQAGASGAIEQVHDSVSKIPGRLTEIWDSAEQTGTPPGDVADSIAQRLIGRG